jgi:hypothetical protein
LDQPKISLEAGAGKQDRDRIFLRVEVRVQVS